MVVVTSGYLMSRRAALERITSAGNTSIEIVAAMFKEYATRTLFGVCAPGQSTFHTLTYGEVWERIQVMLPPCTAPTLALSGYHAYQPLTL